jgi:hypothetical protein
MYLDSNIYLSDRWVKYQFTYLSSDCNFPYPRPRWKRIKCSHSHCFIALQE